MIKLLRTDTTLDLSQKAEKSDLLRNVSTIYIHYNPFFCNKSFYITNKAGKIVKFQRFTAINLETKISNFPIQFLMQNIYI